MSMGMRYEYDDRDWDMINPIHEADREESRDARRFAPEYLSPRDCNHVGGIHPGGRECSLCGDGPW